MPKLPSLTARKILKILRRHNFEIDHITGSHYILYRSKDGKRVTLPYHNRDLPAGTILSIIRQAGLEKKDLLD